MGGLFHFNRFMERAIQPLKANVWTLGDLIDAVLPLAAEQAGTSKAQLHSNSGGKV